MLTPSLSWECSPRRSPGAPRRSGLLRGGSRWLDKLRDPLVAAAQTLAIHRLELGRREGMRRGARKQRFHPRLQSGVFLDLTKLLDPVEKIIALQKRRVSGVDQRIFGTVEEGSATLLFERLFDPLERHRHLLDC